MLMRAGAVMLGLLGCAPALEKRIADGALLWAASSLMRIMMPERKSRAPKAKKDCIGLSELSPHGDKELVGWNEKGVCG